MRYRYPILALVTVAMAGPGCVSPQPHALAVATRAYDRTGIPTPVRQRVHLFLMNGSDVLDCAGLSRLRDRVYEEGFSKVYLCQRVDANWYEREVRRVAADDPSARVVLVGLGAAADKILPLAAGARDDGVNVDAVFLIDPAAACQVPADVPYRTVVIRSRAWTPGTNVIGAENLLVEKTGHLAVAHCPATVEIVTKELVASAGKVGPLPADPFPQTPLSDTPNPTPRPVGPFDGVPFGDDWNFLHAPPTLTPLVVPPTFPPPPPEATPEKAVIPTPADPAK